MRWKSSKQPKKPKERKLPKQSKSKSLKEPRNERSRAKISQDGPQEQLRTAIGNLENHVPSIAPSLLYGFEALKHASRASYRVFNEESFELEKSERAFSRWDVYEYTPLPSKHIRLLRFKSNSILFPWGVSFDLIHVPLDKHPPYEALSYRWTSNGASGKVSCSGRTLNVSTNCKAALKRLNKENRLLWVDAVCINQHDGIEKNHQVALMSQIYSSAERTIAWLGEDKDREASCLADINRALPYLQNGSVDTSTSSPIEDVRLLIIFLKESYCGLSNWFQMSGLVLPF